MGDEALAAGILRLLEDCRLDEEEVEWVTRRQEVRLVLDLEPHGAAAEQAQREFEALDADARHEVLRLAARLHEERLSPAR